MGARTSTLRSVLKVARSVRGYLVWARRKEFPTVESRRSGGYGDATLEGMAMKILRGSRYLILAVVLAFTAVLAAAPAGAATPTPPPPKPAVTTPAPTPVPKPAVSPGKKPPYDHHHHGRFWICRPCYWEPGYWIPGFRWHGHDFAKVWHDRTWHKGYCYWGTWPKPAPKS